MKLKNFYETFRDDLMDKEFVIGYLEDALEEGGLRKYSHELKKLQNEPRLQPKETTEILDERK
jgi:hypothetical protein